MIAAVRLAPHCSNGMSVLLPSQSTSGVGHDHERTAKQYKLLFQRILDGIIAQVKIIYDSDLDNIRPFVR